MSTLAAKLLSLAEGRTHAEKPAVCNVSRSK